MKDKEAVEKLKTYYPGMSKSVFSLTKKPEYYGVELVPGAKSLIGLGKRRDVRRKPYRITFRLTEEAFEQFELARGCDTRQQFCEEMVKQLLQIGG